MVKRPSVEKRCPADRYAGPGARIIEVSWPDGRGCLVSFRTVNGVPLHDSAEERFRQVEGAAHDMLAALKLLLAECGVSVDVPDSLLGNNTPGTRAAFAAIRAATQE